MPSHRRTVPTGVTGLLGRLARPAGSLASLLRARVLRGNASDRGAATITARAGSATSAEAATQSGPVSTEAASAVDTARAATGLTVRPGSSLTRITRLLHQGLAPDWRWWAVACGVTLLTAVAIWIRTSSPLTEVVVYGVPPVLGCAWMIPACLRPYGDARRHLRENIAAPWLLIIILVPSNADAQVRQIVASSPVRTTLAALLAVYTWLGLCQALLSVHHDYREGRLARSQATQS